MPLTLFVPLTLDAQTEQRIQREIDLGHASHLAEVINRALDLLEAEDPELVAEREGLDRLLDERMAAFDRGEGVPGERVREELARLRTAHVG